MYISPISVYASIIAHITHSMLYIYDGSGLVCNTCYRVGLRMQLNGLMGHKMVVPMNYVQALQFPQTVSPPQLSPIHTKE